MVRDLARFVDALAGSEFSNFYLGCEDLCFIVVQEFEEGDVS